MRRILFVLLLVAIGCAAVAQDPNVQRGFVPGKMYDFLGVDSVNTFNGNLIVRIPLGQKYSVGQTLAYQFTLVYNSKVWELFYTDGGDPLREAIPEKRSNAGLGWRLTLGELLPPEVPSGTNSLQGWTYVASDGAEHEFPGAFSNVQVAYTQDSSYLRLRRVADSPTGYHYEVDFPDGTVHSFTDRGQLTRISDPYGNWVKVRWPDASTMEITDGYREVTARTHTVVFAEANNQAGSAYNQGNFQKLPVQVNLAAVGGPARYTLVYDHNQVAVGGCAGMAIIPKPYYYVPLLDRVSFPDGTAFDATYLLEEGQPCTSGTMSELALPTKGKIAWVHGIYETVNQECIEPDFEHPVDAGWRASGAGVIRRELRNAGGELVEKRIYTPSLVWRGTKYQKCGSRNYTIELPPEQFQNTITAVVSEGGAERTVDKTTQYFSSFPMGAPAELASVSKAIEYGFPFYRGVSNGERYLSSRTYACAAGSCSDTVARTTYLRYFITESDFGKPYNPDIEAQRTTYDSDNDPQSICGGMCYSDTAYSDFDGYGHYRQTDLTGNIGGAARTLRTEYAPDPSAWLLNRYTASSVRENGQLAQQMTYTFDAAGLEKSRRVLAGTTPGAGDLLSVTCRDARGFVSSEKWLGGDGRTPPADTTNLCAAVPGAKEYEIVHEYPAGDGFRTWHRARYSGTSFSIADETLEPNTGQVTTTRDTAGLATSYAYDVMGRIASITPPGGAAPTFFTYRAAAGADPARVTSTTLGTTTVEQTYDYDDLGRLFREKRRMPDGSWALRKTDYRGAGATKFVSEWVALASGADENLVTPAIGTAFEQDQFNRTTKMVTPDQKTVSMTYGNGGVREVRRTRTVATPSSSSTSVTVSETYDMHGNLTSVSEPSGPSSAGVPNGGDVRTDYVYDAANRLLRVTMNPPAGETPQPPRQFLYDARGLLKSESHPEKELPVSYGSYDARGHAWTSTDADVPVTFQYDTAERLVRVSNAAGSALKEFVFGTAVDCAYCNGKLRKATRHNYVSGGGDHTVTETYSYGANGLPSSRETVVERPGYQMQKFTQELHYDELLQLGRVDFPACLTACSTAGGLSTVGYTRTRGLLTQIPGYASISYHPSGMVTEVRHETTSPRTDTYVSDLGMARPAKITFGGTTACAAPDAPVITAAASVCSGSTGNQASIANVQSGVTYTWAIQNGTLGSSSGTAVSYTAGTTGQVTLNVTAQNGCSSTGSVAKTVAIASPTATLSGSAIIDAGGSAFVDVALTGTPPWNVTWSDGTVSPNITTSPLRRQVSPSSTTTYQLTAASDASSCAVVRSGSATITVRPPSPASVTATATNLSVQIAWPVVSVAGGARYDVERAANVNGPFAPIATAITPTPTSWTDTAPSAANGLPVAYVYRVLTVAPDGTRSNVLTSPRDYAVTAATMYPSGTIAAGATGMRPQHIVELRRGIDALRKLVNLPETFASTAAPTGVFLSAHFAGLLAPLDAARAPFGYSAFVYANGLARPAAGVRIKAAYITELREVLK